MPNHRNRFDNESLLDESLMRQRKYAEAEPLLLAAKRQVLRDSTEFVDPPHKGDCLVPTREILGHHSSQIT